MHASAAAAKAADQPVLSGAKSPSAADSQPLSGAAAAVKRAAADEAASVSSVLPPGAATAAVEVLLSEKAAAAESSSATALRIPSAAASKKLSSLEDATAKSQPSLSAATAGTNPPSLAEEPAASTSSLSSSTCNAVADMPASPAEAAADICPSATADSTDKPSPLAEATSAAAAQPGYREQQQSSLPVGRNKSESKQAIVVVVIGMAGSGKTTFVGTLQQYLTTVCQKRVYTVNLDPAVINLEKSYFQQPNIDIRDTVDYKKVMQHYRLGPNGAILTALNLFATKFGEVLLLLQQRQHAYDYILVDTPGQIEVFTWSASGTVILEGLANTLPTCVCYILDTPRCTAPITLMSNMLYACSVLYKARLPFLALFNKTDVVSAEQCQLWLKDYEVFQDALLAEDTYMASMSRSSALMLVEFYSVIQTAAVSSKGAAGMKDVMILLDKCKEEYNKEFVPFLEEQRKLREAKSRANAEHEFTSFLNDVYSSNLKPSVRPEK